MDSKGFSTDAESEGFRIPRGYLRGVEEGTFSAVDAPVMDMESFDRIAGLAMKPAGLYH